MERRFSFYEVVQIESQDAALDEINTLLGVILGMAQNDEGYWEYAVSILDSGVTWSIQEADLLKTGRFLNREDLYSGEVIRVTSTEGRGSIDTPKE